MKKILLSCLTILFAFIYANNIVAQNLPAEDANVKGKYHKWVCQGENVPLSLEWDAAARGLSMNNGKWDIIYPAATYPGYNKTNVFSSLGVDYGTFVFEYTVATNGSFCGLTDGQKVRVYIHIVPTLVPSSFYKDMGFICKGSGKKIDISPTNPVDYLTQNKPVIVKALSDAGYKLSSTQSLAAELNEGAPSTSANVIVSIGAPNNYDYAEGDIPPLANSCLKAVENGFDVKLEAKLVDKIDIQGVKVSEKCLVELAPATDVPVSIWADFGITPIVTGTWGTPTPLNAGITAGTSGALPATVNFKEMYTWASAQSPYPVDVSIPYTYDDCDGISKTVTLKYKITDQTIPLVNSSLDICKDKFQAANYIIELPVEYVNSFNGSAPSLDKNATWSFYGFNDQGTNPGNLPTPTIVSNKNVSIENFVNGVAYWFKVQSTSSSCNAGTFAYFVIRTLSGDRIGNDERITVCKEPSGKVSTVDFANMFLIPSAKWTQVGQSTNDPVINGTSGVVTLKTDQVVGTFMYKYEVQQSGSSVSCGNGEGIVYLTVKDTPKREGLPTISLCYMNMPDKISLDNLLSVYEMGVWTLVSGETGYIVNGILDLKKYYEEKIKPTAVTGNIDLKFTPDASVSCLTGDQSLTIKIVDNIIN